MVWKVPIQIKLRTRSDQVSTAGPSTGVPAGCMGCAWFSLLLSWPGIPQGCSLAVGLRCSAAELLSLQAAQQNCQWFAALSHSMASQARDHSPYSLSPLVSFHAVHLPNSAFLIS